MWTKHLLLFMWTKYPWYPTRIDGSEDSAVIETRLYRPPRSSQGRVTSEQRLQAHDWVVQNKWTVQGPKPYYLDMHRSKVQAHTFTKRCVFFEPTELVLLILVWSRHLRLPCPVWRLGLRLNYHSINLKIEDLVSITGVNFSKSRNRELSICSPTERQGTSYEDLQIGNIPYILDTGRVGKKKKYICWAEEATRANQRLGNLCRVPFKTFCENVLTLVLNVKNKSFPSFFLKDGAL